MATAKEGMLLGKYQLLSRLGAGGMADVFAATHQILRNRVAVKVLPASLAKDPAMVERFLREARSAACLHHPNIIKIHDVGAEDGVNFFAMDLVEGMSLTEMIARSGSLPESRILSISRQVLSALAEAHGQGIVHRDLKPDNILVDHRGDAVVTDFGIAKAITSDTRLTSAGAFVGTVQYASPEQARGRAVDGRSDLYSWGVVMYVMATGRTPFQGDDTASVLYQHVHEPPVPPHKLCRDISPKLSGVILRALEKEPADRYQDAAEMLAALDEVDGSAATPARASLAAPGNGRRQRAASLLGQAKAHLEAGRPELALPLLQEAAGLDEDNRESADLLKQARRAAASDRDFLIPIDARGEGPDPMVSIHGPACNADPMDFTYEPPDALTSPPKPPRAGRGGRLFLMVLLLLLTVAAGAAGWWLMMGRPEPPKTPERPLVRQEPAKPAQSPKPAVDHLALAREHLAAGRLDKALEDAKMALEASPQSREAKDLLARVSARQTARKALESGQAYLAADRPREAAQAFQEALAAAPGWEPARQGLAKAEKLLLTRTDQARKEEELKNALTLAGEHLAAGRTAQARKAYERALALDPANQAAKQGLEQARNKAAEEAKAAKRAAVAAKVKELLQGADKKQGENDLDGAVRLCQRALSLDPEDDQAKRLLTRLKAQQKAAALVAEGEELAGQRRFDQAAEKWRAALAWAPDYNPALEKLAGLPARRADFERKAAEADRRRLAQEAAVSGAKAFNEGRYPEAVKYFEAYLAVFPEDKAAKDNLKLARDMLEQSRAGRLVVGSLPPAEVYLDGRLMGKTPLVLPKLKAGPVRLLVKAFGGAEERTVEVAPKETTRVNFRLAGGALEVNSLPWANVLFDGRPLGQTPVALEGLTLGPHEVRVIREGHLDQTRRVVLNKGEVVRLVFRLERRD